MLFHNELKAAVYTKLTSASTFNTNIGGRVVYGFKKEDETYPNCVFNFAEANFTFDSGDSYEDTLILINLFDNNHSSGPIGILESNLVDLLDGYTFTFTNYTQISLVRQKIKHIKDINFVFNTNIEYRIEVQHK